MSKVHGLTWHKKKTWTSFSKYIRIRDALKTTGGIEKVICCSCQKEYNAFGKPCVQAGHFIPGRIYSILFEPTCVAAQCYNCNVNLKSNWVGYYEFMLRTYGMEEITRLIELSKTKVKFTIPEFEMMRDLFEGLYRKMLSTKELHELEVDYEANIRSRVLDSSGTPGTLF